jgi:hypothetical protein
MKAKTLMYLYLAVLVTFLFSGCQKDNLETPKVEFTIFAPSPNDATVMVELEKVVIDGVEMYQTTIGQPLEFRISSDSDRIALWTGNQTGGISRNYERKNEPGLLAQGVGVTNNRHTYAYPDTATVKAYVIATNIGPNGQEIKIAEAWAPIRVIDTTMVITEFRFVESLANFGVINPNTITVTLPYADRNKISSLRPRFTAPLSKLFYVSGSQEIPIVRNETAINFTNPVEIRVRNFYASNYRSYMVNVEVAPASSATRIAALAFNIPASTTVDILENNILVKVPAGSDTTAIRVSRITLPVGATISPLISSGTILKLAKDQLVTVTAEDRITTRDYTISLVILPYTDNKLLSFKLQGFDANTTIASAPDAEGRYPVTVTLPPGTSLQNRVAEFTVSTKAKVVVNGSEQQSGVTALNFTQPVDYYIFAEDPKVQPRIYRITVK